ncbi:MAG: carboxypeptidase M32 [Anaerolineae bacterium]|nr:carboxypeptidase M32 [Anaerolineae bacterium]MCB9107089.1 carboxypeptidase M32 [Anaerolineales bacterium]
MQAKLDTLNSKLKDIQNINHAAAVLGWDQQTYMPPGGAAARAEQLSTLSKISHEMFTAAEIGELLADLAQAEFDYDSDEASLIRVIQRDYDKARKLPPKLVEEMSRTFSMGQQVWTKARAEKDFSQFQDILAKIVDLNIQVAEAYGYEESIYDALLDQYEPDMKASDVQQVFDELKAELVPLVQAIAEHQEVVDDFVLQQEFDEQTQWDFGLLPLQAIGFDMQRGRQDKSAHPFTTSFSTNDVRITTRFHREMIASALFGTLHEGGHALYEQNSDPTLEGTPLAGGTSLGVHESQSRLWENVVGRSREFWQFYYPKLQEFFPKQFGAVDREVFYRAINKSKPSLIRVEADEVTYNLHIFLRFELEQALLTNSLKVADLPEAWNAKMESYLGLTPPDDAKGVLQDIHWSGGMMGYFPTYTLGNILSLQFYSQTLKDLPDLPEQFAKGEFGALLEWFREHIHRHGRKFTANELIQRVTGDDGIKAGPYLNYIKRKYSEIYELA